MVDTPTPKEARESLAAHVAARGAQIHEKYGPHIGWSEFQRILADRECVRYPCELIFDAALLLEGEPAHAAPKGERPEDGFNLVVHPFFSLEPDRVPFLALYQLVVVNYGVFASPDDAEVFGSAALGIPQEDYYTTLCAMADELAPDLPAPEENAGGVCGCT